MAGFRIDDEEKEYMLGLYETSIKNGYGLMATYGYIARATHHTEATVSRIMRELNPTTKLATAKLRAASSKLVDRLIAKAEVPDILDIFSRPNIGVLAPAVKGGSGDGPTGIFVSVQSESCGAVKVGVIQGQGEQHGIQAEGQGSGADSGREHLADDGRRRLHAAGGGPAGEGDQYEGHAEEVHPRRADRGQWDAAEVEGVQVVDGESQVTRPEKRSGPRSKRRSVELEALKASLGL